MMCTRAVWIPFWAFFLSSIFCAFNGHSFILPVGATMALDLLVLMIDVLWKYVV